MKQSILNTLILAGGYLMLFALGELLYHYFKVKAEMTRKMVHVGTGLLALLFPLLLANHWLVLLLCATFLVLLIGSRRFNLLQSINRIERKSIGSLAYPFAVYGCYLAYWFNGQHYVYYYLPILLLAICDPIAGLCGKKWPIGPYRIAGAHKTLMGSVLFMLSALFVTGCYFMLVYPSCPRGAMFGVTVVIALLSTLAEAVSRDGYDNITIPAAAILGLLVSKFIVL